MSTRPRVAGVVVTFHPDAGLETRLTAIARETDMVIVVDNTGDAALHARLTTAVAGHGARLIANADNRGLGAALNQAFAVAAADGCAWVIAFDQDSTPAPGFTAALAAAAEANPKSAAVGANWRDEARPDFASRHLRPQPALPFLFTRSIAAHDLTDVTCVITSGTLFRIGAWRALGGFDEGLFLDLVDTEFCLRARSAGRTIVVAAAARLAHNRGAKRPVRRFGRTWWPAFMPPDRLRYLSRNRLAVAARVGWREPHWLLFELAYSLKIIAEVLLCEDRKTAKLAACARGTWDGLLGVSGRIPPASP